MQYTEQTLSMRPVASKVMDTNVRLSFAALLFHVSGLGSVN